MGKDQMVSDMAWQKGLLLCWDVNDLSTGLILHHWRAPRQL